MVVPARPLGRPGADDVSARTPGSGGRRRPGWHSGPPAPNPARISDGAKDARVATVSARLPTSHAAARDAISALKARLQKRFREFQELSLRFRRSEVEALRYYRDAVEMIGQGDADEPISMLESDTLFCRLAMTLPDGVQKSQLLDARCAARLPAAPEAAAPALATAAHETPAATVVVGKEAEGAIPECPLCFSPKQDTLLSTACGHPICVACLQAWQVADAEAANSCAVCRAPLVLLSAPAREPAAPAGPGPESRAPAKGARRRGRRRAGVRGARTASLSSVSLDDALSIAGLSSEFEGVGPSCEGAAGAGRGRGRAVIRRFGVGGR